MSDNHKFGGPLFPSRIKLNWMEPRENAPVFQYYEVFIRTCLGSYEVSRSLRPKVTISGHNPAQEVPASVKVTLWGQDMINEGELEPYDPTNPLSLRPSEYYFFITRQGTKDIYWVRLNLKKNLKKPHRDATVKPSSPAESSQRPRHGQLKPE